MSAPNVYINNNNPGVFTYDNNNEWWVPQNVNSNFNPSMIPLSQVPIGDNIYENLKITNPNTNNDNNDNSSDSSTGTCELYKNIVKDLDLEDPEPPTPSQREIKCVKYCLAGGTLSMIGTVIATILGLTLYYAVE